MPDESYSIASPKTWVGFLAQQLAVKSLVNLAANSHGNMLTANNIMSLLNRFKYDPSKTIVLFNITDAARLDLMCDWSHPDASPWCTWPQNVLDFKYLSQTSDLVQTVRKNTGIDQIETASSNALHGMISFLTANGYNFKFLTMRDYSNCAKLSPIIDQYYSHWIDLDASAGLVEYVQKLKLTLSNTDFHPNMAGHKIIADGVYNHLTGEH